MLDIPPIEPVSLGVGVVRPDTPIRAPVRRPVPLAFGSEASAAADSGVVRPLVFRPAGVSTDPFSRVGGGRLDRLPGVPIPPTPLDGARAYMLRRWTRAMIVGSGVCMLSRDAPVYRGGVPVVNEVLDACDMAEPGRAGDALLPSPRSVRRGIIESRLRAPSLDPTVPCADGGR